MVATFYSPHWCLHVHVSNRLCKANSSAFRPIWKKSLALCNQSNQLCGAYSTAVSRAVITVANRPALRMIVIAPLAPALAIDPDSLLSLDLIRLYVQLCRIHGVKDLIIYP
jgi:hypothetical protein